MAAQIAATVQVAFPEPDILACWQTLDEGTVVGIYASLLSLIQSASIACDYTKAWIPASCRCGEPACVTLSSLRHGCRHPFHLSAFFMTAFLYDGAWQWQENGLRQPCRHLRECICVICGAGALHATLVAWQMLVGMQPWLSETGTVVAICAALLTSLVRVWQHRLRQPCR